jgi:hypothetical protein
MSRERRKELVEPENPGLSITKQCRLLQISRSLWYYEAKSAKGILGKPEASAPADAEDGPHGDIPET